jgi:hypothetical protein
VTLQQVLHPAAEKDLLGQCDEQERENPSGDCMQRIRQHWMQVKESQQQSERDGNRRIESRARETR